MNQKGFSHVLIIILVILFVMGAAGYLLIVKNSKIPLSSILPTQSASPISQGDKSNDFFFFEVPKPVKDLTKFQLPNNGSPRNVIAYKDSLWFAGNGSLIEYDTKSGKLLSYSDMTKANCDSNVVLSNNFIFTSCHTDNVEDAFDHTEILTTPVFTGHYSVFKINPVTHQIERVFSYKDGLENRYNYELVADGDTVWIETFKGVAKIDSKTDKVYFYPQAEIGVSFGGGSIIPDKDYVWAYSIDRGLALFDKKLQTWNKFSIDETIGTVGNGFIDTRPFGNGAKLIEGGLQVGIYAGDKTQNNCLLRKYDYATKQWLTTKSQHVEFISNCEEFLKTYFTPLPTYTTKDENGLTQIKLPNSEKIYQLDGRDNYILSQVIDGKRYILTSATIDVVDDASKFREILVKLGELPSSGGLYADQSLNGDLVSFLIDTDTSLALVTDSNCAGQGCGNDAKVWLIDLRAGKIKKLYTEETDGIKGELLFNLNMKKDGDLLVVNNKEGEPIFNINTTNLDLTILKSKQTQ